MELKLAAMKIEDADKIYQYLITRPYKEVSFLIDILKNLTAVDDPKAEKPALVKSQPLKEVKADEPPNQPESKAPKPKRNAANAQPQN